LPILFRAKAVVLFVISHLPYADILPKHLT
jgi:hypothetical protein